MSAGRSREWSPEWVTGEGGWAEWRRRVRYMLLRSRARRLSRLSPNQINFIRMDGGLAAWPTLRWDWLARDGRAGREGRARLDLPFDPLPRHTPTPPTNPFSELELSVAGAGGARGAGGAARGGALGAAGSGAAVLALAALLLLARALERCLHTRVFKPPRPGGGWFAAGDRDHVAHTGLSYSESEPSGGNSEFPSEAPVGDNPPPYSECAAPFVPKRHDGAPAGPSDEAPPPYSACYVAFSNPKDGPPSVHFLNGQRQMFDNRQSLASETGQSLAPETGQSLAPDTDGTSRVGCDGTTELQVGPVEAGVSLESRNRGVSASEATSPSRITVA